ncbi:methylthioribulose-1-phosphate dehydratase domain protein [Enterobacter sp. OLF]|nr:methylthioribulose-1-phosphate dehydratase domain protein [Enterobacter sp. OLF]
MPACNTYVAATITRCYHLAIKTLRRLYHINIPGREVKGNGRQPATHTTCRRLPLDWRQRLGTRHRWQHVCATG